MDTYLTGEDRIVTYSQRFREYGVPVPDGGNSSVAIKFCPWCSRKLPESLRSRWFEVIEALGFDPYSENVPKEFQSDLWWKSKEQ